MSDTVGVHSETVLYHSIHCANIDFVSIFELLGTYYHNHRNEHHDDDDDDDDGDTDFDSSAQEEGWFG